MIRPDVRRRLRQATILRTPFGASGLNHVSSSPAIRRSTTTMPACARRSEEDSERGQNEQGSSRLDGLPRTLVRRSFTAESLWCGGIVSMAVGPTHEIVQTINANSGGVTTRSSRSRNAHFSLSLRALLQTEVRCQPTHHRAQTSLRFPSLNLSFGHGRRSRQSEISLQVSGLFPAGEVPPRALQGFTPSWRRRLDDPLRQRRG